MASREDMEDSEVDEADGRGESEGEATVVEGAESDSAVVEVTVLRRAGLPLEGTAVEAIVRGGYIYYRRAAAG
jgi:hypothetical protein